jgi:hypothetical protein
MTDYPELERYLDEVSAHLGRYRGKKDVLLELRTAALDRAEDLGDGKIRPETVAEVVRDLAEPAEVALAYGGDRFIIGPRMYRAFLIYTAILFVVHLVMIVVATATGTGIEIFAVSIVRVENPHSLLNLASVAVQALLFDIGLMVVIFGGIGRARQTTRLPSVAFRVPAGLRASGTRALLALLVLLILNPFRDEVFVVLVEDRMEPLFTATLAKNLVWINLLLALVIGRETAYACLGERRWILFVDTAVSALGTGLMIWFLTQPPFIRVPGSVQVTPSAIRTLNDLMHKATQLIFLAFAVGFAVVAVKRLVRALQTGR